jgi:hypothetical protein
MIGRMRSLLLSFLLGLAYSAHAKEYVVPAGDVGAYFAKLPADATYLSFSAASSYSSEGDIVLPDVTLLVIDGKGCTLKLGPNSNGFTRKIADQKDAQRRTSSRYLIKDFAAVEGGRKGVDLQASLGSIIINCRFRSQTEVAIDLRFCLMARIENVLVTSPAQQGIVVRDGDWPGATGTNSQSNSTVLDQCRVYASSTTTNAFAVINSGGVRMIDCISEGEPADRDLLLSAAPDGSVNALARNPVVKSFTLENFHVEHRVRKASIVVNMPPKAAVVLRNIYWNGPMDAPVIEYISGQLTLMDIGWWNNDFRIRTRISAPRITAVRCPGNLNAGDRVLRTSTSAGAFVLADPLPGNEKLNLSHIKIQEGTY